MWSPACLRGLNKLIPPSSHTDDDFNARYNNTRREKKRRAVGGIFRPKMRSVMHAWGGDTTNSPHKGDKRDMRGKKRDPRILQRIKEGRSKKAFLCTKIGESRSSFCASHQALLVTSVRKKAPLLKRRAQLIRPSLFFLRSTVSGHDVTQKEARPPPARG